MQLHASKWTLTIYGTIQANALLKPHVSAVKDNHQAKCLCMQLSLSLSHHKPDNLSTRILRDCIGLLTCFTAIYSSQKWHTVYILTCHSRPLLIHNARKTQSYTLAGPHIHMYALSRCSVALYLSISVSETNPWSPRLTLSISLFLLHPSCRSW